MTGMNDILIIGGGVVGLSLAWELAGHGLRVHVVERGEPGREASWAGAGILPAARREPGGTLYAQLSAFSRRLHAEWAQRLREETGIDTGFRVCGELHVARTPADGERVEQEAKQWEEEGLCVERLTVAESLAREPALASGGPTAELLSAVLLPDAAQVRNPRHVRALATACQQRGVKITTSAGVEDLELRGGRVEGAITSAGRFTAQRFALCAGAWTEPLLARLGHKLPLKPIRGQMVLMNLPRQLLKSVIHEGPHYLVPRDDGRVLVGSTLEDVGFDKRTTGEAIAELTAFAHSIVPALRDAEIEQTWAGLRPGSALAIPLIGPLPGFDNVLLAAGHFRWGLYLSPGTAVLLRQWILGEECAVPLDAFWPGNLPILPPTC
jgi:glycine oxidase